MTFNRGKVIALSIGLAFGLSVGLAGGLAATLIHLTFRHPDGPKPPPSVLTGENVVVIVDDDKPTIAEGAVIDGPSMRALKATNRAVVRSDQWKRLKDKNYDQLITQAGGLDLLAILAKDGRAAYVGKLPMEESKLQQLLNKYVTALPPPASEALTATVPVSAGGPSNVQADPNGDQFVVINGHRRMLSVKPGRLQSLPRYSASHPVFPESEWREIDRRPLFGSADWILDQDGHSSCVGNSTVSAFRKVRQMCGMTDVKLSPAALYAQINQGRDSGAVISDIIPALQNTGTCSFALVGQEPIFLSQLPKTWKKDAARFKLGEAYQVDSWEELGSALQTGRYLVVFATQVGNTWTHFDRFGIAGHDRGPGNHALHADGMRKAADGRWVLDVPNSWGYEWGPWKNGRVFLDKNHLFANGMMQNAVVIRVAQDDPNETNDPPAYRATASADGFRFALAP